MPMLKKLISKIIFVFFVIAYMAVVHAVPNLISYQGVLNDQNGQPVTGTVNVTFRIYDVGTGGDALWNETQAVQVETGLFNVKLGAVQQLSASVFASDSLYLGIQVGADTEMTPRQRITAGPYLHSVVPIGTIMAWAKDISGVPALADSWVECNGQTINDPQSLLNGQIIPDLNGQNRFLRGSGNSGATGGNEFQDLKHNHNFGTYEFETYGRDKDAVINVEGVKSSKLNNVDIRPPFYDVIWIMRIK